MRSAQGDSGIGVGIRQRVPKRRKPIAAGVAATFLLAWPMLGAATTWTVNSCDEGTSGDLPTATGTLRFAAANAASGDTIDMSGLTCSTISLHTGAIVLHQANLNIGGPGKDKLTITGVYNGNIEHDRIFTHTGTGRLELYGFAVSNGDVVNLAYQGFASGGCIYSAGAVTVADMWVHNCQTLVDNGFSQGGGIYAKSEIMLKYSLVSNNIANSQYLGSSGGGAYTPGTFFAKYTTIVDNTAGSQGGFACYGGALTAKGDVTLTHSTVSDNFACTLFGGINSYNRYGFAAFTTTVTDSTISGNHDGAGGGAVYSNLGKVNIYNSTIAFNSEGLAVQNRGSGSTVKIISNLIAYNGTDVDLRSNFTLTGSNNFIRTSNATMPNGTITTGCPMLGPLAYNGGLTKSHRLHSVSVAIDKGANPTQLHEDQRGIYKDKAPFPYPRVSGMTADIGAYEVQQNDVIFDATFETCG